jgi:hypothetical protein
MDNRRQHERYPLMVPIGLEINGRCLTGELFDMSEDGAKIRLDAVNAMGFTMLTGDPGKLKINMFSDIVGHVAWIDEHYVGLILEENEAVLSMIAVECARVEPARMSG